MNAAGCSTAAGAGVAGTGGEVGTGATETAGAVITGGAAGASRPSSGRNPREDKKASIFAARTGVEIPFDVGTAGENITVEGLDWDLVIPGVRLCIGDRVLLEVASFTKPCKTIKGSFTDGKFVRIAQKLYPGWSRVYARVLTEGEIHFGDPVEVLAPA
jgi:hypothetical protein